MARMSLWERKIKIEIIKDSSYDGMGMEDGSCDRMKIKDGCYVTGKTKDGCIK